MAKLDDQETLRRYTTIPVLLDMLVNQHLAICNSDAWDDRNDRRAMEIYKDHNGYGFVGAACLTGAAETIHHWKIFAPAPAGVCIVFNKSRFMDCFSGLTNVRLDSVEYMTLARLDSLSKADIDRLPFIKRWGFKDESEFRVLGWSTSERNAPITLNIEQNIVDRIVFSPFMPQTLFDSCRRAINQLDGWRSLVITQSNLIDNKQFQFALENVSNLADRDKGTSAD